MSADVTLTLDNEGQTITVKLARYLGDRFNDYRNACSNAGATYVYAEKVNRVTVEALSALIRELNAAGLVFQSDANVSARLKDEVKEVKEKVEGARERTTAINARLAPKGLKLYRYQETGVEWLATRQSAMLVDEMGLGKTVQALLSVPADAPVLVVCPSSLRANWIAETRTWTEFDATAIKSKANFRWPNAGEVVVAPYTCIPSDDLPPPPAGTHVIADEVHYAKNPKAQRTQRLAAIIAAVKDHGGSTWGITGTPLLNRAIETWNLLKLFGLEKRAFGSWWNFTAAFDGKKGRYGMEWGRPDHDKVSTALRKVSLRRIRAEVLRDLPAKTRQDVKVNDLKRATRKLLDSVQAELEAAGVDLESTEDVLKSVGSAIPFTRISALRAALATAKIPAMLEAVESYEESETPLVVFSCHRAPVDLLKEREGWEVITGDTEPEERQRIVEAFQAGTLKGVAGTLRAMGVGLTLTHAAHMLFVDLDWTPANINQAEDRICRIGQKAEGLMIKRLVADHAIDRMITRALTVKQRLLDAVDASAVAEDFASETPVTELEEAQKAAEKATVDLKAQQDADAARLAELAAQAKRDVLAGLGDQYDGREIKVSPKGKCRGPANATEAHAEQAILTLAALDPDRAAEENAQGFNRMDGEFGHTLAGQIRDLGMLSDKQWEAAVRMVRKYHRQVGAPVV
jgi:SWI/SNF-related matrix-associated actin-dependent regulator 1 of chromatin subfamily A